MRAARTAGFWICHSAAISAGEGRILKNDTSLESLEPIESMGTKYNSIKDESEFSRSEDYMF